MTKKPREALDVPLSLIPEQDPRVPAEGAPDPFADERALEDRTGEPGFDLRVFTIELPTPAPKSPKAWVCLKFSRCRH